MSGDTSAGVGEPAIDAVTHLQQAATSLIAALRAALDAAEALVNDPGPLLAAAEAMARAGAATGAPGDTVADGPAGEPRAAGGVRRIPVGGAGGER